ncbi:MAG: hypothetical protein INF64_14770 [Roseomonas sp.]|nr:hypothetical protein [Roseomonas sp.]
MIDCQHALPLAGQAKALSISRGTLYYVSRPVPAADLALMRRIGLQCRFVGSRMMQGLLKQEGFSVGRLHVATLLKRVATRVGMAALTSAMPGMDHKMAKRWARSGSFWISALISASTAYCCASICCKRAALWRLRRGGVMPLTRLWGAR